jgi:hypothetical protein
MESCEPKDLSPTGQTLIPDVSEQDNRRLDVTGDDEPERSFKMRQQGFGNPPPSLSLPKPVSSLGFSWREETRMPAQPLAALKPIDTNNNPGLRGGLGFGMGSMANKKAARIPDVQSAVGYLLLIVNYM